MSDLVGFISINRDGSQGFAKPFGLRPDYTDARQIHRCAWQGGILDGELQHAIQPDEILDAWNSCIQRQAVTARFQQIARHFASNQIGTRLAPAAFYIFVHIVDLKDRSSVHRMNEETNSAERQRIVNSVTELKIYWFRKIKVRRRRAILVHKCDR